MRPDQKELSKWPRRFWVTVGVLVAIFLGGIIWGKITDWRALNDQKRSRADREESLEKDLKLRMDFLQDEGALDQHIASSKVDVCYIDSQDQGWFAVNYLQKCYLRYVEGFTTTLSKDEVEDLKDPDLPPGPTLLRKDPIVIRFRPGDCSAEEISLWLRGCEKPGRISISSGDPGAVVKDYRNFVVTSTNPSENQVWIVLQSYYYSENLGCDRFPLIIFCESPRRHAIQAP